MSSIQRTRKLALVDCNSFYVSCERLFNPRIRKKPVVVLSNNDGCIISRSNEAKALGIKMGEPYFKEKDKKFLTSGSKDFSNRILINEEEDVFIWGVVTYVIHSTY